MGLKQFIIGLIVCALGALLFGAPAHARVYTNDGYGYIIDLPDNIKAADIVTADGNIGVELDFGNNKIIIRPLQTVEEVYNFNDNLSVQSKFRTLVSSAAFVTASGIEGYITNWLPRRMDGYRVPPTQVVLLGGRKNEEAHQKTSYMFFLPLLKGGKIDGKYACLLMIDSREDLLPAAENIAKSFRYVPYFKKYFNEGDNNRTYRVKQNSELAVELLADPSTGYAWQIDAVNPKIFEITNMSYMQFDNPNRIREASGVWTIEFAAVKKGTYVLSLPYRRAWERVEPLAVYNLTFIVE